MFSTKPRLKLPRAGGNRTSGPGRALLPLAAAALCPLSPAHALTLDPSLLRPSQGLTGGLGGNPRSSMQAARSALTHLRTLFLFVFAIGAITAILFLLLFITKLGAAGDNPQERKRAITGILVSGLSLSLLGGLGVVLSLFWNLI